MAWYEQQKLSDAQGFHGKEGELSAPHLPSQRINEQLKVLAGVSSLPVDIH